MRRGARHTFDASRQHLEQRSRQLWSDMAAVVTAAVVTAAVVTAAAVTAATLVAATGGLFPEAGRQFQKSCFL